MAFRTVSTLHIQSTTVAQPLVGSWITAGIGAPASQPITLTLGTATSGTDTVYFDAEGIFRVGDPVWLIDPVSGTAGGLGNAEPAYVTGLPGGNQLTIGSFQGGPVTAKSHVSGAFGTGTWILLKQLVNNCFVQMEDGTGGTYSYIGDSPAMSATYRRIVKLAKVGTGQMPYNWNAAEYSALNPFDISELWILGGAGNSSDGYTPSFCLI